MKKPFRPRLCPPGAEALCVSQEATAIKAALHKQGYQTRNQSKNAAWKVFVNSEGCFLVTHLPKPSYCWALYPESRKENYNTIWHLIQGALQESVL
jgi:hypothetical protein